MRRKTRDFGRLKLVAAFLFISVFVPNIINAINSSATDNLGQFEAGETGIKLCATIDDGFEDSLRFYVSNDQGFASDIIVDKDTCRTIKTEAATYTIRQYVPQEYVLESVAGGTVNADNTPFIATSEGQYSVIYNNTYTAKKYLHSFGATTTTIAGEGGQGGGGEDPCESNLLYRHIECLAKTRNVVDTNMNLADAINVDDPNSMGVNIYSESRNAEYPVYYYRGANLNQHVIWENKCWNLRRTTTTGGVKMEYQYEAREVNGALTCEHDDWNGDLNTVFYHEDYSEKVDWDKTSFQYFDSSWSSASNAGYMYGANYDWDYMIASVNNTPSTFSFSNDVTYENGVHTLAGDIVTGTLTDANVIHAVEADHHYFCLDGSTSCSSVAYYSSINPDPDRPVISYYLFTDTANVETAKAAMFTNTYNSQAKQNIDNWFAEYFSDKLDKVEDTPYCNDRATIAGSMHSKDTSTYELIVPDPDDMFNFPNYGSTYFTGAQNFEDFMPNNYRPNLNCDNTRDTFTVSSTIGNGALTYPVAITTQAEQVLSGTDFVNSVGGSAYVDDPVQLDTTTMTPLMVTEADWNSEGGGVYLAAGSHMTTAQQTTNYFPMLSLKYGAEIVSGTGSLSDPYIVQ